MSRRKVKDDNEGDGAPRPQILVERVDNVSSSTAGAGSGDFHHYRQQRKRERARIYLMEKEHELKVKQQEFEDDIKGRQDEIDKGTEKKSVKRKKKKDSKIKAKQQAKVQEEAAKANQFSNDGSFMEQFLKMKQIAENAKNSTNLLESVPKEVEKKINETKAQEETKQSS